MISGREEKIALILILTVILITGTFAFFMESSGIDMFAASYSEDAGAETLVKISGIADNVMNTQTGGHMTAFVNGVKLFVPADIIRPDIHEGDYILVSGIVEEYMDEMEIRAIKIKIIKKTD